MRRNGVPQEFTLPNESILFKLITVEADTIRVNTHERRPEVTEDCLFVCATFASTAIESYLNHARGVAIVITIDEELILVEAYEFVLVFLEVALVVFVHFHELTFTIA